MLGGSKPRLRPAIEKALADGAALSDTQLVKIIFGDRRAIQRLLVQMHDDNMVHVAGWIQAGNSYRYRPQYLWGDGDDVDPPLTKDTKSTPRVHKFRESLNADDKDFDAARRRQKRRVIKRDPLTAAFFGG
jgi:hypothetical protein